jgi:hypothetical protein
VSTKVHARPVTAPKLAQAQDVKAQAPAPEAARLPDDYGKQGAASAEPPALPGFTPVEARDFLFSRPAGESPMPGAPTVVLDGSKVVPSQYKLYNQTVSAVQEVVSKIAYKPNMHVFVSSDGGKEGEGVYLQVGVVGVDNYPIRGKELPEKIVYGRKWRVEQLLPTSELIQTVMLALKSAEEHETRERFVVNGYTPLNNHLDLPLLKQYLETHERKAEAPVADVAAAQKAFDTVHYAGCKVQVMEFEHRKTGKTIVDVELKGDPAFGRVSKDVDGKMFTVVADGDTPSQLIYALMDTVLHEMNRGVEENFSYDGFKRFSRDITLPELRDFNAFSRNARNFQFQPGFAEVAKALNRGIDAERPPIFMPGPANDPAKADIESRPNLLGAKPKGL